MGADEARDGLVGAVVCFGRLLAQAVDAPVHIGVVFAVVAVHRLQHTERFLGGRSVVEIHEFLAVDSARERGELLAQLLWTEAGVRVCGHGHSLTAILRSMSSRRRWRTCSISMRSTKGSKKPSTTRFTATSRGRPLLMR